MSGSSGNSPNNPPEAGQRRDVSWLGLETKLEQHEVDAMTTDPAGFVASQIAEGYQSWQVIEKLTLAGIDRKEATAYVERVDARYGKRIRSRQEKAARFKLAWWVYGLGATLFAALITGGVCL